jgi:two-component system chemotaxis response regulator CheB
VATPAARAGGPPLSAISRLLPGRVDAVVIGVSTGGPNALARVLPVLPPDLPVPVLIVQHMPAEFTGLLAKRLAKLTPFPVREAAGGERLGPRQAWVAPGGSHLAVAADPSGPVLTLQADAQENSCRPAADVLFRSAAAAFGTGVLAVVMTGMGQDGLAGCRVIRAAGGRVLAQDEATSVVWGMPGCVVRAGLADHVLAVDQLADEIVRLVRVGRA